MWTLLAASLGCTPVTQPPLGGTTHFDPASGTTLTDEGAAVSVVGLDDVEVCVAVDVGDPGYGSTCAEVLGAERTVPLTCGFHVVTIRWGDGEADTEEANYLVDSPSCADAGGWATLWQNDELVVALVAIKDDLTCRMNGCENPSGVGDWSTDCGAGSVAWHVSLDGLRAISTFRYAACTAATTIQVHDPADPWWEDEAAVVPLEVTLTLDGTFTQDTDFDGNGTETGTVQVSGDFDGAVASVIQIDDAARGGGWFEAGCAAGPVPGEVCAPGEAMIRYDYPDWSCHGSICPEPGDPPVEEGTDADGDGVVDADDVCPDVFDPFQLDSDGDGVGDLCDLEPGWWGIQFETDGRCLVAGTGGDVSSTTSCIASDPGQQWEVGEVGGAYMFKSRFNGACLSHTDAWLGPWTVVTATCDEADPFQQWSYEWYDQGGLSAAWPGRLHATSDDFCAYTDFTGNVYGTIANCSLAGTESNRKVGIFPYGDLAATPIAPG